LVAERKKKVLVSDGEKVETGAWLLKGRWGELQQTEPPAKGVAGGQLVTPTILILKSASVQQKWVTTGLKQRIQKRTHTKPKGASGGVPLGAKLSSFLV